MTADPPAPSDPAEGEPSGVQLSPVLDQRFDVHGLYQLRAAVAAHSAELGVPPDLAHDIVIAAHELATNAVRHGPGRGRLRLWRNDAAVICEVADDAVAAQAGPAWLAAAPASNGDLPWPVEPGHGLWLTAQVSVNLQVRRDNQGATVTVTFAIRR